MSSQVPSLSRRLLAPAAVFVLAACQDIAAPALGADYLLSRVNGLPLPYDAGPVPPRPGLDLSCHLLIVAGALHFDSLTATFTMEYSYKESCTERVIGGGGSRGRYTLRGGTLLLTADLGEGRTQSYAAALSGNDVSFTDGFYAYVFRK